MPQPPQTLVGAGDIAMCADRNSIGGAQETAKLLDGVAGTVFTAGDNVNDNATGSNGLMVNGQDMRYAKCYEPTWGRHKSRTRPSPGNHDRQVSWDAYFNYFGATAAPPGGYYSYDLGSWHILALNSEVNMVSMLSWLDGDLAGKKQSDCILAYWHRPLFNSGQCGSNDDIRPLWDKLQNAGGDLVINGHCHRYERFAPQDASGNYSPSGIVEVIAGTGGAYFQKPGTGRNNSAALITDTYGVVRFTLRSDGYDGAFVTSRGVLDFFTGSCGSDSSQIYTPLFIDQLRGAPAIEAVPKPVPKDGKQGERKQLIQESGWSDWWR